jgi:hypothetical protein
MKNWLKRVVFGPLLRPLIERRLVERGYVKGPDGQWRQVPND